MPVGSQVDGWSAEMRRHAYSALDASEHALGALQGQASELIESFRTERKALLKRAQAELIARTPLGRKAKKLYGPLNLLLRVRGRGLELVWEEVHRTRVTGRLVRKNLRLTRDGHADLRMLLAKAVSVEMDLVRETEALANAIRTQWRQWVRIGDEAARALYLPDDYPAAPKSPNGVEPGGPAPASPSPSTGAPGTVVFDLVPSAS